LRTSAILPADIQKFGLHLNPASAHATFDPRTRGRALNKSFVETSMAGKIPRGDPLHK